MSIDTNTKIARKRLKCVKGVSKIKFGKIRRDGTRGVKYKINGEIASFSYLTDIPKCKRG